MLKIALVLFKIYVMMSKKGISRQLRQIAAKDAAVISNTYGLELCTSVLVFFRIKVNKIWFFLTPLHIFQASVAFMWKSVR